MVRVLVLAGLLVMTMTASFAAEVASADPQPDGRYSDRPWYSLFLDNRSDKFTALRIERADLMRQLGGLQVEVEELRDEHARLDATVAQLRAGMESYARAPIARTVDEDPLTGIERKTAEYNQTIRRTDIRIADQQKEIERLKSAAGTVGIDETSRAKQIAELERQIAEGEEYKLSALENLKVESAALQRQIDTVASETKRREDALKAAQDRQTAELAASSDALSANVKATNEKQAEIAKIQTRIEQIDAEVLELIDVGDTDGLFKIIISLSFALLVAGVIFGFFWVVSDRPAVIDAIFTNDSGIQFVTIFSIVIAVILFGIIGVLEGRELSALLGGLSGYILGRNAVVPMSKPSDGGSGGDPPNGGGGAAKPAGGATPARDASSQPEATVAADAGVSDATSPSGTAPGDGSAEASVGQSGTSGSGEDNRQS